jgi:aspartyl-tRNA(Asn)/glutamyl-tRNA(Gln) amidotransferase subunit A
VRWTPPSRIEDAVATERTHPRQALTLFNVTGHPALAIMAGLSSGSLPLSFELVGRTSLRQRFSR